MMPLDDVRLRKALWTVYWRGTAQVRERIEEELRLQRRPRVPQKEAAPDPAEVLAEVTKFIDLARAAPTWAATAGCTTPSGPSGGIRSVGWRTARWRR